MKTFFTTSRSFTIYLHKTHTCQYYIRQKTVSTSTCNRHVKILRPGHQNSWHTSTWKCNNIMANRSHKSPRCRG